jgi:hypothetical protein
MSSAVMTMVVWGCFAGLVEMEGHAHHTRAFEVVKACST